MIATLAISTAMHARVSARRSARWSCALETAAPDEWLREEGGTHRIGWADGRPGLLIPPGWTTLPLVYSTAHGPTCRVVVVEVVAQHIVV